MQRQARLFKSSTVAKKGKITVLKSKSRLSAAQIEVLSGGRDAVLNRADRRRYAENPTEQAALEGQELPRVALGFFDTDDDSIAPLPEFSLSQDSWETEDEDNPSLARLTRTKKFYMRAKGYRTRQERYITHQLHWDNIMPDLVNVYLEWKRRDDAQLPLDVLSRAEGSSAFAIEVEEIFRTEHEQVFVRKDQNEHAVLAMMRYGFIASTPLQPAFGAGMRALELYRQLRLHHPRLGFQPFARTLAALANIPYRPELRRQFSDAFDVYLLIRREVTRRVNAHLGRAEPDWRVRNACPACNYKLEAEPSLAIERLWAMDGNGSLKRHASGGSADVRKFVSDYFLENADDFKDEVRRHGKAAKFNIGAEPGDSDDRGDQDAPPCQDSWKNMQPEHMKRQLDFFEQTGIFLGACRHGLVLFILEMVRSGELAKYPLALVSKLMDVFPVAQRGGYDIGCGFSATLSRSSLGARAKELGVKTLTNAFHGHAHHRLCQLVNHPLVTNGVALEDFETCERVFSESNDVARTIRFAMYFHWRQFIDMHFQHWDNVKYAELSKFIIGNYKQALGLIKAGDKAIAAAAAVGIEPADFEQWQKEEYEYLEGLKKEPDGDALAVAYVESLVKLENVQARYANALHEFNNAGPENFRASGKIRTFNQYIAQLDRTRSNARRDLDIIEGEVRSYEEKLEVPAGRRWTPLSNEWRDTLVYIQRRQFHRALDHLERLVVQRLLELTKANMSDVCYKLRDQIAKALQRRSRAIQTALKNFNIAHKAVNPHAQDLQWKTIAQWSELSDFSLLRMARQDICDRPWANLANREFMTAYFKKLRAHEEIERCNVEARRLRTWIEDEDRMLAAAAEKATTDEEPIAVELRELQRTRARVNHTHRVRLIKLEKLNGFSGTPGPGTREGSTPTPTSEPMPARDASRNDGDDESEGSEDEGQLEVSLRMEAFETAISGDDALPIAFFD